MKGDGGLPNRIVDPATDPTLPATPTALTASELRAGEQIDRYVVVGKLGQGGMGVVYTARDPDLDRLVALKLIAPGRDASAEARLLREAQAMAKLADPNVVNVYDVGIWNEQVFVAMELVEGMDLAKWLGKQARPWNEVWPLFRAAGRGLCAAHAAGIVHRDFKPSNVLVDSNGRARVTDFGLARAQGDPEPSSDRSSESGSLLETPITHTGSAMGTPAYMAPEQHLGRVADARADQFAFCVSLYEALYGQRPFRADSVAALATVICDGHLADPPSDVDVPGWIHDILRRGLEPDPDSRFESMEVLLAALADDPRARRRRRIAVAGTAVAFAGLAGLAVLGFMRSTAKGQQCKNLGEELRGVWDEKTAAAMTAAFEQTGRRHAVDTARRASAQLDAYARAWTLQRTKACRATRVQGARTEAEMRVSMSCLDERRDSLRALTAVFTTEATGEVVDHAIRAAGNLGDVSACANVRALGQKAALPTDAGARAKAQAVLRDVARARALESVGRYKDARRIAEAAATRATALGHAATMSRALYRQAIVTRLDGDAKKAMAPLEAALESAATARDHELVALAWIQKARFVGYELAKFKEAETLRSAVETAVRQAGAELELRARMLLTYGLINNYAGRAKRGMVDFQRALELLEKLPHPNPVLVARAKTGIGVAHAYLAHYDEAARIQREVVQLLERHYGAEHPAVGESIYNYGNTLTRRGRFADALRDFRRALAIRTRALGPDHFDVGTTRHGIALALYNLHKYKEALPHAEAALKVYEAKLGPDHADVAGPLNELGSIYAGLEDHDRALKYLMRSIEIKRKTRGQDSVEVAIGLFNVGNTMHTLKRYAKACRLHDEAAGIFKKRLGGRHPYLAYALTGLGDCKLRLGERAAARTALESALAIREKSKDDPTELAQTRLLLARALPPAERTRALSLLTQALAVFKSSGEAHAKSAAEAKSLMRRLRGR